jgi:Protein of unknown function/AsmA-like C-terminal region
VIAVVALLAGLAIWRLSSGPVSVDFLTPYLEQSFAGNERGLTVDVEQTVLAWGGRAHTLDLRARNARILNPDGSTVAALPEVSVSLSLTALLRGMIAATEIDVTDARVTLIRESDGRFTLATRGTAEEVAAEATGPELSAVLPALIELFTRDPERGRAIDYLNVVRVVDGQFIVIDRRLKASWFAPDARMELRRHERGVAASMGLKVAVGPDMANATLAILFDQPKGIITVAARLAGFHADAVAAVAPLPEMFSGIHVPLEANVQVTLTPQGQLTAASFDVIGGGGELSAPPLLPKPKAVAGLTLHGRFDGVARRLEINTAEIEFGTGEQPGPLVSMTAAVQSRGADLDIAAEANVSDLQVDELADYWPGTAAPNAREWVTENIRGGLIENGRFSLVAKMPGGRPEALEIGSLDAGFDLRDVAVHYLRPMPPITDIRAHAVLDGTNLRFQVDEGRQGDLAVRKTSVDILDMTGESRIEVKGTISGPLRAALEVLDHEKLNLLSRIGLDPASASGESVTQLAIGIPLVGHVTLDRIAVSATAEVRNGAVARFLMKRDASDMDLDLTVDTKSLTLKGPLKMAGVPADIDWQEDFTGRQDLRTRLHLDFPDLGTTGRRDLGLDLAPYVEGPISVAVIATIGQDRAGALNLAANLAAARLSLPFLRWQKPAGQAGAMRLSLALKDEAVAGLNGFDVTAGTLLARGGGELMPGGSDFRTLRFDELAVHGTTLRDVTVERVGEGLAIDLGTGILDAAAFLTGEQPETPAETTAAEVAAEKTGAKQAAENGAEEGMPLKITGTALDSIYFAEGRYLRHADLSLERSKIGWERVHLHGEVPEKLWRRRQDGSMVGENAEVAELKTFDLTFGPSDQGDYRLDAKMNDMGAGLRALGIIDTIEGGGLEITATSSGPAPNHPMDGRIEATDYLLRDAPVMAKLLSLASFTGILNVMSGDGLKFKRLIGAFRLQDGVVSTELLRAYGNALGLTAKGTLNFGEDRIDLEGTVVPAYTVNRIIGEIPLLGSLLVGGEGEGFVAVVYGIDGKLSDPQVSVNPLSVLTPGFLRGVFELKGGEGDEMPSALPGRHNG